MAVRAATGLVAAGVGTALYGGVHERTAYTLRRREVPVLAPGSVPLRVLHLSDLHVTPNQHGKFAWLSDLARLVPDLVVLTGDVLSDPRARQPLLAALEPLFAFPGLFVPGNNDYYAPTLRSPHHYLKRNNQPTRRGTPLDWPGFARELAAASGWRELTNIRARLEIGGRGIDLRGVDDARLRRDRTALVAGPPEPGTELALGLTHTPEPRVLDAFTADGVGLILSGHTHGGQIRLPGVGALVTNCGIDRGRAWGLSRHEAAGRRSWLHVSAGLGTSPFAPFRLNCRPEATLLALSGPQ
ncbi:metallophosphoesterase [Parafrankia elaeagni]|uniref:metallophosphoesterase n=1 Tax=Parafrankia elaeagni TaxID=222534 RepID=UPI000551E123|nr:metallophosphoesterase [Parafrankia elaeagni]